MTCRPAGVSESRPVAAAPSDVVFQLLTSVPLHGFQRSTAAALCDLTTEVLRTINATENAMVEYGLCEPVDRSHLVGTDVKQADDAFRELEENVSFKHELHASSPPNLPLCEGPTNLNPPNSSEACHQSGPAAAANRAEYQDNKLVSAAPAGSSRTRHQG